jgi:hypothetical protein
VLVEQCLETIGKFVLVCILRFHGVLFLGTNPNNGTGIKPCMQRNFFHLSTMSKRNKIHIYSVKARNAGGNGGIGRLWTFTTLHQSRKWNMAILSVRHIQGFRAEVHDVDSGCIYHKHVLYEDQGQDRECLMMVPGELWEKSVGSKWHLVNSRRRIWTVKMQLLRI